MSVALSSRQLGDIAAALTPSQGACVWLRAGKLFDGLNIVGSDGVHLVYDASAVRYVGVDAPPRALVGDRIHPHIDLPRMTVVPGLIEAHAHLFLDGAPIDNEQRKKYLAQSPSWMRRRAEARLPRLLRMGVMAVRDAGDRVGVGLQLSAHCRVAHQRGEALPYLDSPGAAIHHKGRYGSFMSDPVEDYPDIDTCVHQRIAAGAHRIKLIATGIINFKTGTVTAPPQMSVDELRAFAAAARRQNRQTFAHATGAEGVGRVIDAEIDTVEHGFFITDEHLMWMRDLALAWTPTFAPVQVQVDRAAEMSWDVQTVAHLQRILDQHARALQRATEIGVTILTGSDAGSCGVPHGEGLLREMELMQQAGLSSLDVLRAATGHAAQRLGLAEPIGMLTPGRTARFILTPHAPLVNVAELRKNKIIVFDGHVMEGCADDGLDGM